MITFRLKLYRSKMFGLLRTIRLLLYTIMMTADIAPLPSAVKQLLYLETVGPGARSPLCPICHNNIQPGQASATHDCCGTTLCMACFTYLIFQKTRYAKAHVALAADCPWCKRPILRPHPYAGEDIIIVASNLDLVRRCIGDMAYFSRPLISRQQHDLLTDEQAMMMLDPEGRHPRAQQQYEEMKVHRARGWRVYCFPEVRPSTFLVAEGWKMDERSAIDLKNVHPALRQEFAAQKTRQISANAAHGSMVDPKKTTKPGRTKRFLGALTEKIGAALKSDNWKLASAISH